MKATITDGDLDTATATATIGDAFKFEDDGPSISRNSATAPTLVTDDSDTPNDTASASFAALFTSAFGKDGFKDSDDNDVEDADALAYSLSITGGNGTPSGMTDVISGDSILLRVNGAGDIEGYLSSDATVVAFTIDLNPDTGSITLEQDRAITHNDPLDPAETAVSGSAAGMAAGLIVLKATITDGDLDTASATANIGGAFKFEDDGPSITTVTDPLNIPNTGTPSGTGNFAFSVGKDLNSDFDDISVSGFTVKINGVNATNVVLTPDVNGVGVATPETANTASYKFTFQYDTGIAGLTNASGTLVFNKATGQYTVTLDSGPIQGITLVETSDESTLITEVNANVSVAQLTPGLFAQFTGMAGSPATTIDYNPDAPPSDGIAGTYIPGEVLSAPGTTVQVSSVAAGVAGNTLQGEEIMDINLYATNPGAVTNGPPTASADALFITLDGVGAAEDMVVVLKLWSDTNNNGIIEASDSFTTRAVMVTNADLYKFKNAGDVAATNAATDGTIWEGVANDIITNGSGNDALIIIESNDFNVAGENWQIVGAQLAGGNNGVSGSAINLNRALGAAGDSDTNNDNILDPDNFTTDTHDGPFKILSIGFQTESTTAQQATIEFDVTVTDGDGDTAVRNDITVNIGTPPAPPVVLDLDGDGVEFIGQSAGVTYDYGYGAVSTAWVGADDGILVRDANLNGLVDNASEFVFGSDGQTDMEALHAQYGAQLDASDADFVMFAVWNDANSNGVADAGELASLAEAGIASIGLVSDGQGYAAANGDVQVAGTSIFTRTDGSTGKAADAMFSTGSKTNAVEERVAANSNNVVLAAALAAAGLAVSAPAAAAISGDEAPTSRFTNMVDSVEAFDLSMLNLATDTAVSALMGEYHAAFATADLSFRSSISPDFGPGSIGELIGGYADHSAPTALLAGTDMMASPMAAMMSNVAMPSGEAMMAMAGLANAKSFDTVEKIVADALQGGGATDINALLNTLPGQDIGANAGIDMLASLGNANVPTWDTGHGAAFTFGTSTVIGSEALVLHHDAIQPVANG